jgi:hypothetical protein
MGYSLYSEDGYVHDVASISGWSDLCGLAEAKGRQFLSKFSLGLASGPVR